MNTLSLTILASTGSLTVIAGVAIFLIITLLLVAMLLVAKKFLVKTGQVRININNDKDVFAQSGKTLLSTLADQNVFLSSACGGKGSCGQCKVQVFEGGGNILPTETVHFTRKEMKDNWRLGCQVKVKDDMKIGVPASVLDVKEWECEVISNKNVATFIKEFIVALPPGEHMNFLPGSYAQIKIPTYEMDYDKDIDKSLIGEEYLPAWEKFGLFGLKCRNTSATVRAYSMANYPEEGDRIMLTVRIATPPFKPKPEVGFQDVMPGIASSYIFTLKPGDKVVMSGPYGDFHPILQLEKDFPNFKFHLALDRPDPAADAAGVKYTPGFVHQVIYETYLKNHPAPEDIEYYMCGPGPMSKAVEKMLWDLGVPSENLMYDNFGG